MARPGSAVAMPCPCPPRPAPAPRAGRARSRPSPGPARSRSASSRCRSSGAGAWRTSSRWGCRCGGVEGLLDRYLHTLLVLIPLGVGLAALGGALIARAALRPVDEMTRIARRITAEDLSRRVERPRTGDEMDAAGRDPERDAGASRGGLRPDAPLRGRRRARAANPAGRAPRRDRGDPAGRALARGVPAGARLEPRGGGAPDPARRGPAPPVALDGRAGGAPRAGRPGAAPPRRLRRGRAARPGGGRERAHRHRGPRHHPGRRGGARAGPCSTWSRTRSSTRRRAARSSSA